MWRHFLVRLELFLKASRVELEIDTSQFEFQSRLEAVGYMEGN